METGNFLIPGCSLRQFIEDITSIHKKKNDLEGVLNTPIGALGFFASAEQALLRELSKHGGQRIASILPVWFMRFFVLVQATGLDRFLHALMAKYPRWGCSYCGQLPCTCGPVKEGGSSHTVLLRPSITQHIWSLWRWQGHHARIYGRKTVQTSIQQLLNWQAEELFELTANIAWRSQSTPDEKSQAEVRQAIAEELADTFMRTLAIATRRRVDVESGVINVYGSGCWRCKQRYCACTASAEVFDNYREMAAATRPAK